MLRHSWIPAVAFVCSALLYVTALTSVLTHTYTHTQARPRTHKAQPETPPPPANKLELGKVQSTLISAVVIVFYFSKLGQCHFPFVHVNHRQYSKPPPPYLRQIYCLLHSTLERSRTAGQLGFSQCYRPGGPVPGVLVLKRPTAKLVVT